MDAAHLESLIIFPLGEVVLFPSTLMPLHVFEPRYRAMVRDALEQKRPIGMATMQPDGSVDAHGRPNVRPYIGIGKLVDWDELPDGRYLIVLEGQARARIIDEYAPERPYRLVRAAAVPDEPGDESATRDALNAIRGLVLGMQAINPRLAAFVSEELEKYPDPADFSNRLAAMIGGDTEAQYRLLETVRVSDRLAAVVERLSDILARMTAQAPNSTLN